MEIPSLVECTNVFVCGPVSSGKTHLLKTWTAGMERSVTLDLTAACMGPEYTHVWDNPSQVAELLESNPFYYRVAFHPLGENTHLAFKWIQKSIWVSTANGASLPRWLVVDEVHEVSSVSMTTPEAKDCWRYARHVKLGVIGSSQRIPDVSKLFTDSCRMVVLFYTMDATSLDAIRARWGRDVMEQVTKLRPCIYDDATQICEQEPECLVWVRGRGTKIFSLGDKRKAVNTTEATWQSSGQEPQKTQAVQSSGPPSGSQENQLPESTLAISSPRSDL